MTVFLRIAFYFFAGSASYATIEPSLICWDYPDKFHPKLTITQNSDHYELELVSLPDVQDVTDQLFPDNNNSFAEKLIIKFKECQFKKSRKNVVGCANPTELEYYNRNGLLMNQAFLEDRLKLSFANTNYKTEESLHGKIKWISFEINLQHKKYRAARGRNFYSAPLCGMN